MIIAIGGISRSGKTKLAKKLRTYFAQQGKAVALLSADDYMFAQEKLPLIRNHTNCEIPASINFEQLIFQIKTSLLNHTEIIIIEGHLIYAHPQLLKLINCAIFFTIDKATFVERKAKDLRFGKEPDWYINHCWEAWQQYGQIPEHMDCLNLDGNRKLPFNLVLRYIEVNQFTLD